MANYPYAPRGGYHPHSFQPYQIHPRGRGRGGFFGRGRGRGVPGGHRNLRYTETPDTAEGGYWDPQDVAMATDSADSALNFSSQSAPRNRVAQNPYSTTPARESRPIRAVNIDEITFDLSDDGKKLTRLTPRDNGLETPQQHEMSGVKFFRTKNGNLIRFDVYKLLEAKQKLKPKKRAELCSKFNTTGQCTRDCLFTHDVKKISACKAFLAKGSCPAGSSCPLSHDLTPNRTPSCIHFSRGHCTNPNCRYIHVKANPHAPVCNPFARLGYCEDGASCPNQHVFECPDYANLGRCSNKKCRLPHVDRADQLRKLAGIQNEPVQQVDSSSPSASNSDKDERGDNSDDVESDFEDDYIGVGSHDASSQPNHEFSQQRDFIRL